MLGFAYRIQMRHLYWRRMLPLVVIGGCYTRLRFMMERKFGACWLCEVPPSSASCNWRWNRYWLLLCIACRSFVTGFVWHQRLKWGCQLLVCKTCLGCKKLEHVCPAWLPNCWISSWIPPWPEARNLGQTGALCPWGKGPRGGIKLKPMAASQTIKKYTMVCHFVWVLMGVVQLLCGLVLLVCTLWTWMVLCCWLWWTQCWFY